jgi:hypothetical protein
VSFTSTIRNTNEAPAVEAIPAPAPKSKLISKDANRVEFARDSTGRMIGAKPIDALDMFEISCLLGEHSGNGAVLNQALMASSVVKIDDRDVTRPLSMIGLKARIKELGFQGYAAASEAVSRFSDGDGEVNADAIKN